MTRRTKATFPSSPTSLGERFLHARRERGLTQKELAAPTLTASYISHIESGKARPSLKTLAVLAQRLDYPMQHFLAGDTEAPTLTDTATDHARSWKPVCCWQAGSLRHVSHSCARS